MDVRAQRQSAQLSSIASALSTCLGKATTMQDKNSSAVHVQLAEHSVRLSDGAHDIQLQPLVPGSLSFTEVLATGLPQEFRKPYAGNNPAQTHKLDRPLTPALHYARFRPMPLPAFATSPLAVNYLALLLPDKPDASLPPVEYLRELGKRRQMPVLIMFVNEAQAARARRLSRKIGNGSQAVDGRIDAERLGIMSKAHCVVTPELVDAMDAIRLGTPVQLLTMPTNTHSEQTLEYPRLEAIDEFDVFAHRSAHRSAHWSTPGSTPLSSTQLFTQRHQIRDSQWQIVMEYLDRKVDRNAGKLLASMADLEPFLNESTCNNSGLISANVPLIKPPPLTPRVGTRLRLRRLSDTQKRKFRKLQESPRRFVDDSKNPLMQPIKKLVG